MGSPMGPQRSRALCETLGGTQLRTLMETWGQVGENLAGQLDMGLGGYKRHLGMSREWGREVSRCSSAGSQVGEIPSKRTVWGGLVDTQFEGHENEVEGSY